MEFKLLFSLLVYSQVGDFTEHMNSFQSSACRGVFLSTLRRDFFVIEFGELNEDVMDHNGI